MGPRRAAVLIGIHVLIIIHILHWKFTGSSVSPIEPSESIEFSKDGTINAGLIMFAIAMISTAIFGRWFCGWACHVVALQDACGWMMKKIGVRPKPFRSRLLIYVPLLLALYMFVWPLFFRLGLAPLDVRLESSLGADHWFITSYRDAFRFFGVMLPQAQMNAWQAQWHLTTESFWRTFPGVWVAIPFLLVCGFGAVYLLGAKGFCTYGCPYGGFFAPLDELAPVRIRVTDACEHCGHCTAVCTSNVRVHDEVATYGMVVDAGCMKCLDCVSACPNDALYLGVGRPAAFKKPVDASERTSSKSPRADLTGREEIAFGLIFLATFASIRGIYGIIPMLMAVGMTGCITFMMWKSWRMLRTPNVSFLRSRLRYHGQWRKSGLIFAAITAILAAVVLHSGWIKLSFRLAEYHDSHVLLPIDQVFASTPNVSDDQRERAETALGWYASASSFSSGGTGLLDTWQTRIDERRAWLHAVLQQWDAAESALQACIEREGLQDGLASGLARVYFVTGNTDATQTLFGQLMSVEGSLQQSMPLYVSWMRRQGMQADLLEQLAARTQTHPEDAASWRWYGAFLLDLDRSDEAISALQASLESQPYQSDVYPMLAAAHLLTSNPDEAVAVLQQGIETVGPVRAMVTQLVRLLRELGRFEEAADMEQLLSDQEGR